MKHFFSTKKTKNLYEILQVTPKATSKEIKSQYFNLSKLLHPDVNKSDSVLKTTFLELTKAYETLKDPTKRTQYDRKLSNDLDLTGNEKNYFKVKVKSKEEDIKSKASNSSTWLNLERRSKSHKELTETLLNSQKKKLSEDRKSLQTRLLVLASILIGYFLSRLNK